MKAAVYEQYGPPEVLHIGEVPKPEPKEDEVLIRIHASTVNRLDVHTREANRSNGPVVSTLSRLVSGWSRPRQRVLGSELSGVVERIGAGVQNFKVGDEVFGVTGLRFGAHAEFTCVRAGGRLLLKPSNVSFEEAAAVCDGFMNAIACLNHAHIKPGTSVLVYGASGSIGTAGVQIARHLGAGITAVCPTKTFDLLRSLGASEVSDYNLEDFTKNGKTYDVVFDAVGKLSFASCKGSLNSGGYYLATDGFRNIVLTPWTALFGKKKVVFTIPPQYPMEDLRLLSRLLESGEYRAVIDRTYALEDVVEATRYVESQQKIGNVVLQIA